MKRFKGSDCQRVILEVAEIVKAIDGKTGKETHTKVHKDYYCDLTSLTVGAMDALMPVMGKFLVDVQGAAKIPEGTEKTLIDIVLKSLSESPKMLVDVLVEVAKVKDAKSGEAIEDIELSDWFTKNVSPPALLSLVDISIGLTDLEMYGANFMQTQTQLTGMLMPKQVEKKPKTKTTPHPAQQRKH